MLENARPNGWTSKTFPPECIFSDTTTHTRTPQRSPDCRRIRWPAHFEASPSAPPINSRVRRTPVVDRDRAGTCCRKPSRTGNAHSTSAYVHCRHSRPGGNSVARGSAAGRSARRSSADGNRLARSSLDRSSPDCSSPDRSSPDRSSWGHNTSGAPAIRL